MNVTDTGGLVLLKREPDGNWTRIWRTALKTDIDNLIREPIKILGISNNKVIRMTVTNRDYRYGRILLVTSSHTASVLWAGTNVSSSTLAGKDLLVAASSDGFTITLTMDDAFQHGFLIVGGGCCSKNNVAITLSS